MDFFCRYLFYGNGYSCWFDKLFFGYVFKNGRVRVKWQMIIMVKQCSLYFIIIDSYVIFRLVNFQLLIRVQRILLVLICYIMFLIVFKYGLFGNFNINNLVKKVI